MDEYRVFMDGAAWCATGAGFENLQESDAGFGASPLAALGELIVLQGAAETRRCDGIRDWQCNCCQKKFARRAPPQKAPDCPQCKAGNHYVFERHNASDQRREASAALALLGREGGK